uniref:Putative secreted protein n=1 Tax=Ixodes ricinus TaxID=34613 RepID=A0A6B0UBM3_IXORI
MAPSRSTAWWWSWTPVGASCAACTLPSTRSTCSPRCWSTRDTFTWAPTGTLSLDASSFKKRHGPKFFNFDVFSFRN